MNLLRARCSRLAAALLLFAGGCIPDVVPDKKEPEPEPEAQCEDLEPTCGPAGDESCCASKSIAGGNFSRLNDDAFPAHVSTFELDRFEVTVGRFRQFVTGYMDHWPEVGAGKHPRIADSGWQLAFDEFMPEDDSKLLAEIGGCGAPFATWTDEPGANEALPMNCLSWYVAFAFCAWDGGRLPTEAEWNFAAAGGDEKRFYPWGGDPAEMVGVPFSCESALATCVGRVGATSPASDGRFGQADMGGNMAEWTLDYHAVLATPCTDCAALTDGGNGREARGGDFAHGADGFTTWSRLGLKPETPVNTVGVRCARDP